MKENHEFTFYFGGTSITKGGGFEPLSARTDIRPMYKEKYGIDLPSQEYCSYPSQVAKNLKASKFINDAKSGSGTKRIIRKAVDYIINNYLKQPHGAHLFHFEFQPGIRQDIYFSKESHYGICNASWNEEKKKYQFSLVKEWFTEEMENRRLDKVYGDGYQTWIDNHFDEVIYHKEDSTMIMNFIGWLDSMGMQNEYTFSMGMLDDCVWFNPKIHQFQRMEEHPRCINRFFSYQSPWGHAHEMGWLILDEIDFSDNHLGYWGAKKFANKITSIIGELTHVGPAVGKYRADEMEVIEFCTPHPDEKEIFARDLELSIPHLKDMVFKQVPPDNCKLLDITHARYHQGSDFNEFKHHYEEMYPIVKKNGGKVMVVLRQESWVGETEKFLKDVVIKEWGFKEEDFIILDCNIKRAELDYLIKTYQADPVLVANDTQPLSSYFKNTWNPSHDLHHRDYGISCFVNKPNALRYHTLDKLLTFGIPTDSLITARNIKDEELDEYNDVTISDIKSEFPNDVFGLDNKEKIKLVTGKSIEDYIKPENEERHNSTIEKGGISYESVIEAYKESYLNIGMETYTINDKKNNFNDYMGILEHISEKTLLPLFCGTMTYMIFPGDNYKIMEDKWGLNFKYLKEEFDIDYRENDTLGALKSITKIVDKTKQWNIGNWHELGRKYKKVNHDNYKVLENALYTDETQFKLLKTLNHHINYKDRPRHK